MPDTVEEFNQLKGKSAWPRNPILIMTMGLPYSGKSTWAREQAHLGAPIVCPDSIRLAMHGFRFIKDAEDWVWAMAKTMVRTLFHSGHDMVILDACSVSRRSRELWRDDRWTTHIALFDVPAEECKRRARELGDEIIIPIIEGMALDWEEPVAAEEHVEYLIMHKRAHVNAIDWRGLDGSG